MKYIIDGEEFDTARQAADHIMGWCEDSHFDNYLDELHGDVEIGGYEYATSEAMKEVDPTAYRSAKADWSSEMADDIESEIENMYDGGTETFYDMEVEAYDNEQDCVEEEGDGDDG